MAVVERVSANEMDWENVIEEIESAGCNERNAVESHLVQALLLDLKTEAWPLSREAPHRRAEARGQGADARRHFSPSMAQRIDGMQLYREALQRMPDTLAGHPPLPVPPTCPVTLAELLAQP